MSDAPDFGHKSARAAGVCIDWWGAGPLLIRDGKRRWFFEFSDRFGPTLLRAKDFEPADRQPMREDDPFWRPFTIWLRGGKKCRAIRDKRGRVRFWVCHWKKDDAHG